MRDYAKVGPTIWTGETGKALRKRGSEAVIAALYLISSPHSNMLGLYYQPIAYMGYETGLGEEGARKGLQHCIDVNFCSYDEDTEMVFVHEMAEWQIAPELKATDKRCKGVQRDYESLPDNPFLGAFFSRYCEAFHLSKNRGPTQAPSKPHRSQEQEQEQEQEQDPLTGKADEGASGGPPPPAPPAQPAAAAPPPPTEPARKAAPVRRPAEVAEQTWADWLALRRRKKADVTQTVLDAAVKEAKKAGMTLDAFLVVWCLRGSQGLSADWLRPNERGTGGAPPQSFRERDTDAAAARVAEATGGLAVARTGRTKPIPETFDMEGPDASDPRFLED